MTFYLKGTGKKNFLRYEAKGTVAVIHSEHTIAIKSWIFKL